MCVRFSRKAVQTCDNMLIHYHVYKTQGVQSRGCGPRCNPASNASKCSMFCPIYTIHTVLYTNSRWDIHTHAGPPCLYGLKTCNLQLSRGPIVYSCQNSVLSQNIPPDPVRNHCHLAVWHDTVTPWSRATDRTRVTSVSGSWHLLVWSGGWAETIETPAIFKSVTLVIQQSRGASLRSPSARWRLPNRENASVQGADRELRSHVVCSLHAFVRSHSLTWHGMHPCGRPHPHVRPNEQHVMYMRFMHDKVCACVKYAWAARCELYTYRRTCRGFPCLRARPRFRESMNLICGHPQACGQLAQKCIKGGNLPHSDQIRTQALWSLFRKSLVAKKRSQKLSHLKQSH